jgi:hypothetical protein
MLQLPSITLYRLCNITEGIFIMNLFQLMHLFCVQNRDMSKIACKEYSFSGNISTTWVNINKL